MAEKQKVFIIIPTYNEKDCIASTIDALQKVFSKIDRYSMNILVFDSSSPDGTLDIVKPKQQQYSNLYYNLEPEKSGLGSAYAKAMRYAVERLGADIVFEYDADGSHAPEYLIEMMRCFDQGADVVVGSRYVKGGSIPSEWQLHRKVLSVLGNWVARAILTFKYKDFTSGFRGTRAQFVKQLSLTRLLSRGYAYKLQLFWELHLLGAKIVEVPIVFVDREQGESKLPKNTVSDSLRVVFTLRLRRLTRFF